MSDRIFAPLRNRLAQSQAEFNRDESGALLIFGLVLFTLMAIMGGIALDLMRYETTRVTLQNTLDRSTLAAAALTNGMDPETVVRDYFRKAGLSDQLATVTVTEAMNTRRVRAVGVADTQPFFLHMIGVDDFRAKARAAALADPEGKALTATLGMPQMSGKPVFWLAKSP